MEWIDEEDLDDLANAVVDAGIALRVACLFARPRGPGSRTVGQVTRAFDGEVDELLDSIAEAPSPELAARMLDRLCGLIAATSDASERLSQMPGAHHAWNELLHGRAELGRAYQHATAARWRAWSATQRAPERLRALP